MKQKMTPVRQSIIKHYSQPRGAWNEPLIPRLRKAEQKDIYAVGFHSELISSDDSFYPDIDDRPMGFIDFTSHRNKS
jgi:hypothetical protein